MFKKIKNKVWSNIESKIAVKVQEFETHTIDLVCERIKFLSVQDNFTIDNLIEDLKNGGYKNDKEKSICFN